jgi:hypothetical protein
MSISQATYFRRYTLNKIVILSLSLLLLLVLIPGCITVQPPSSPTTPPVIMEFSSNPSTINSGGKSILFWDVTGANSVSIDQGIGQVGTAGIKVLSPATSTTYTITATNYIGTITKSAVTTVSSALLPPVGTPPVITQFSSNPSAIDSGGTSVLFWNVTGAKSVSIDQGIGQVAFVGFKAVSPATSTAYTISATNSAGTVTRSTVTTINLAPLPPVSIPLTGVTVGVISGESGSMIKSDRNYTRLPAICVGDNGANLASRAFLSFDISWLPSNAVIDDVALNLGGYTSTGLPTYTDPVYGPQYGNFGALEIYRVQYGTYENLDTLTYNDPGDLVSSGKITSYPVVSPWKIELKDPASGQTSVRGLVKAGQPRFQLRMQFFTSTNWNGVSDSLCFDRATLTVKYHLP